MYFVLLFLYNAGISYAGYYSVLRERSRLTLEGYERVMRAEEETNAARHEMRHHMVALAGILQDGDLQRAAGTATVWRQCAR